MKNTHGRTCKRTKVYIYLYISLYENLFENGCIYIYIYIYMLFRHSKVFLLIGRLAAECENLNGRCVIFRLYETVERVAR